MESFIYKEMNMACRLKDTSKINYYGAYASALSFIIHCGNKSNKELGKVFTVFRGFSLPKVDFENTYKVGDFLSLNSFTSTTLSIDQGFKYALGGFSKDDFDKIPVLLEIDFEGANQFFFLNSDAYSAYAYEKEVLFQDGIKFKIESKDFETIIHNDKEVQVAVIKLRNVGDKFKKMNICKKFFNNLIN